MRKTTSPTLVVKHWAVGFLDLLGQREELKNNPASGLLGVESAGLTLIQYWRSFDALEACARNRDGHHWPVWVAFNKQMARSRGDVGIWHETYKIAPNQYDAVYSGMPARGLGKVSQVLSVEGTLDTAL